MIKGSSGKDWSGSGNTQTSGACRTRYQQFRQSRRSGAGTRYLASLDRASESSSWSNWSIGYMCVLLVDLSPHELKRKSRVELFTMCEHMGWWQRLCPDTVGACACPSRLGGRTSAPSQLWACYGRIFPGSWSPLEAAAFHRHTALCACDFGSGQGNLRPHFYYFRAVIVLGPRICSYQVGSSCPWEQSSCELWMHRVCLRPSESAPAPSPGSHTHPSGSFWQHPLWTSSPSPLPSGYLEYRKTQQTVTSS